MSVYLPGYVFDNDLEKFLRLNRDKFGLTEKQEKEFADVLQMERTMDLAGVSERDLQTVATKAALPDGIRHVISMLCEAKTRRLGPYAHTDMLHMLKPQEELLDTVNPDILDGTNITPRAKMMTLFEQLSAFT